MIKIKLTEASKFQNSLLVQNFVLPIKHKRIFIGRGQELYQKKTYENNIIDLTHFDNTLSRIHAYFLFSPSWFRVGQQNPPQYLYNLFNQQLNLHSELVNKIWQYIKPLKKCILKDLKSKVGIFEKITEQFIQSDMIIQFVLQSFITFHHFEQYSTFQEMLFYLNQYKENDKNLTILGDLNKIKNCYDETIGQNQKKQMLKIWKFSIKNDNYLLLIQQNLVLKIGRSNNCQIQIKDSAISRYQAYLKCQQRKWKIHDGSQIQKSKNGTWKKCRSLQIPISRSQIQPTKVFAKIGTIKCQIQLFETFNWLNVEELCKQEPSLSFVQLGMQNQSKISMNEMSQMNEN